MKSSFSKLEKIFLGIVFKIGFLNRVLFDIEKVFIKKKLLINKSIFICGLPRSGTSILLNTLYSSDKFACSTYRNMPFILSPNIWSFFSKFIKKSNYFERAHKDGLKINIDSPEAFEEVFWKIMMKDEYIKEDKLNEHNLNDDIIEEFDAFKELLCQSKRKNNYISKNNSNILRIGDLSKHYQDAKFIIMYRDPLNQSNSLRKQYINFKKIHKEDSFFIEYMSFLGHFEFGMNYKKYSFESEKKFHIEDLGFWLEKWCQVYEYLFSKNEKNITFLSYENFCKNPRNSLEKIIKDRNIISNIDFKNIQNNNLNIKFEGRIKDKAYLIYEKLNKLEKSSA
ncbi:sulfotransferase [Pelagibacterales bacterium SAG-MED17]|nr:sulfotransferase [Pelagibacterales bacterium SAG-MED17]